MWNAKVGMKVVCIQEFSPSMYYQEVGPTLNSVYTIRSIDTSTIPGNSKIFLRFVEIINMPHRYKDGYNEVAFDSVNFRPLVSKPDQITNLIDRTIHSEVPLDQADTDGWDRKKKVMDPV